MLPVFSATRDGERVRDGLGDERLAAAGRAVQQDPLRRLEVVLVEQVGEQVGQLDRVVDLLDLVVEAADVGVGDVGHLFEDELFDLGPRHPLDEQPGATVHQQVLAGPELHAEKLVAELAHALLVRATDDQRARPVLEQLLVDHHLALDLGPPGEHDVERLVEHDLLAAPHLVDLELGVHGDAHLAAGAEHVHGAVVVAAEERAVRGRRHGELLDLFAQRRDVLPGFTQRGGEAFVLRDGLGELALGLEQALLEGPHPLGRVLEAASEDDDLLLEGLQLILEIADLALVLGEASLVLRSHEDPPSSRDPWASAGRSNLHLGTLITDDAPDAHFPHRHLLNCSTRDRRPTLGDELGFLDHPSRNPHEEVRTQCP